jgi:hypothetical protein
LTDRRPEPQCGRGRLDHLTIDLTDDEHAAATAAVRRAVEEDRFPRAPRLEPLRWALAKLDPAAAAALGRPPEGKSDKAGPQQPRTSKGRPRAS